MTTIHPAYPAELIKGDLDETPLWKSGTVIRQSGERRYDIAVSGTTITVETPEDIRLEVPSHVSLAIDGSRVRIATTPPPAPLPATEPPETLPVIDTVQLRPAPTTQTPAPSPPPAAISLTLPVTEGFMAFTSGNELKEWVSAMLSVQNLPAGTSPLEPVAIRIITDSAGLPRMVLLSHRQLEGELIRFARTELQHPPLQRIVQEALPILLREGGCADTSRLVLLDSALRLQGSPTAPDTHTGGATWLRAVVQSPHPFLPLDPNLDSPALKQVLTTLQALASSSAAEETIFPNPTTLPAHLALNDTATVPQSYFSIPRLFDALGLNLESLLTPTEPLTPLPDSLKLALIHLLEQEAHTANYPAHTSQESDAGHQVPSPASYLRELTSVFTPVILAPLQQHTITGLEGVPVQMQRELHSFMQFLEEQAAQPATQATAAHRLLNAVTALRTALETLLDSAWAESTRTRGSDPETIRRGQALHQSMHRLHEATALLEQQAATAACPRDAGGEQGEEGTSLFNQIRSLLHRIETVQLDARPRQTADGVQQTLTLPVRIAQHWEEVTVTILNRQTGSRRPSRKGKGHFHVSLSVSPPCAGPTDVTMEYTPGGTPLKVGMTFATRATCTWFEDRRNEFEQALVALGFNGVQTRLEQAQPARSRKPDHREPDNDPPATDARETATRIDLRV